MKRTTGFTLLEVLVALAVLAIAMGAIIHVATQSIEGTAHLRDQTFASWVALSKINELLLDPAPWPTEGTRKGSVDLAGRAWRWEARFAKTDDPDLRRLDMTVRASETAPALNTLVAFKANPPKDQPPKNPSSPSPKERTSKDRAPQNQSPTL